MDLSDLENLKNPNTGLVPMKIVRGFAPYKNGDTAGFPPKVALDYIRSGHATLLDAKVQEHVKAQLQQETDAKAAAVTSDALAKAGAAPAGEIDPSKVVIPENWKELHPLKRITLAKQLTGEYFVPKDVKPSDYADTLIQTEADRRAATK
jgi:hypothetical protein